MDYLDKLYLEGSVKMTLNASNAVPAFVEPEMCRICDTAPASSRSYLPGTCSSCGFAAHCEGY